MVRMISIWMVRASLTSTQIMRNEGESNVEVHCQNSEDENRESDSSCDTSEDSKRNRDNKQEGHDEGVYRVEECHIDGVTERD
jgi:hypothetical protein